MRNLVVRLLIGLIFAAFGLFNYFGNVAENPVTGERQRVQLSPKQEVVLGMRSRQQLAAQHGGLYPDESLQRYIDQVGQRVVDRSSASRSPYPFEFHLLRDTRAINAFALPGGQVFITAALLARLSSEAQLAGVLGHEAGHVVARHGAEHLAKQQLSVALINAVGATASDTPERGRQAAAVAQAVNQIISLRYGREDELESDRLGFQFMTEANYDPQGIVELMKILHASRSGGQPPEFLSTHPDPGNRNAQLQNLIAQAYPNGIPPQLEAGEQRFVQVVRPRLAP